MESGQQWELVAAMLAEIRGNAGSTWTQSIGTVPDRAAILSQLERGWNALGSPYPNKPREAGSHVAEHVLTAIDAHVRMGAYPPPELLLALSALLDQYLDAAGKLTLEEVMFGKPKRRTGSFAARSHLEVRSLFVDAIAQAASARGMSEGEIAATLEAGVERAFGRWADADSLLRARRRLKAKMARNRNAQKYPVVVPPLGHLTTKAKRTK